VSLEDACACVAAMVLGFVVSDSLRRRQDERTMTRFVDELDAAEGVPPSWRMRGQ
jgi:hypothetical protein